jgi:hypothetical protein
MAASVVVLQRAFDDADHRKAQRQVRALRMPPAQPGGPDRTLEDVLAARDPRAHSDAAWSSEILSGCRGAVAVRFEPYLFHVDLVRGAVSAGNPRAEEILRPLRPR